MSTTQIMKKIESLLEWEKIMEEAKAEADALRDEIKQEMMIRNTEELTVGQYIIRWTSVLSSGLMQQLLRRSCRIFTRLISSR